MRANRKLKTLMGSGFNMAEVSGADARPGAWKSMLKPLPAPGKEHKQRHEPTIIDDQIVKDVSNGVPTAEIEKKYELRDGYVRDALVRRFGSVDAMKVALRAMCSESAIALIGYAMANIDRIAPGQAIVGAKVLIDGALAIEKSQVDRPQTIDFAMLNALGETLERVEKQVQGTDHTVTSPAPLHNTPPALE